MQNNPEIESILEQASKLAVSKNHEYITLEHVMLALVKHKRFWRCLNRCINCGMSCGTSRFHFLQGIAPSQE